MQHWFITFITHNDTTLEKEVQHQYMAGSDDLHIISGAAAYYHKEMKAEVKDLDTGVYLGRLQYCDSVVVEKFKNGDSLIKRSKLSPEERQNLENAIFSFMGVS